MERERDLVVNTFFRATGWLLAVAIVTLSVVPPTYRPTTAAPHNFEHLAIFAAVGLAFGLGYRFRHLLHAFSLIAFAAAIEIAQIWDPGRHARIGDFVVDATSACVGTLIAWLVLKVLNDRRLAT